MNIEKVKLIDCSLNLGELHKMTDFEHFSPEFIFENNEGEKLSASMRLHISESLDKLVFADPRQFEDRGFAANSVDSKILSRKKSFMYQSNNEIIKKFDIKNEFKFYEINIEDIKRTVLNNYNFTNEIKQFERKNIVENKIAFTCHDPNIIGGGNTILFRLINWLSDLGVKVSVYSCGSPPSWKKVDAEFHCFKTYDEMFNAITEDVVILYSMWHIEGMLKSNSTNKAIYHIRQIYEPFHYGTDYESMISKKPVIELLESLPIGVVTISPHLEDYYRRLFNRDSYLIANGIDPKIFFPVKKEAFNENYVKILSVGDPNHFVKGSNVLFEALRKLAFDNRNTIYEWNIANGSKADFKFNSVPKNLIINKKSGLNQIQMRAEYNNADIYINPSLYEGFGLPTLEAMLCGTPVVQADNLGLDFIIEDGKDCLLVPVNDSNEIALAIEKISKDKNLANSLIKNAFKKAHNYTTYSQFELFQNVFESILNTKFDKSITEIIKDKLKVNTINLENQNNTDLINFDYSPLVSIILPSYNQAEYLKEALDSIIAQTYSNWEAIVINDGSKDNTEEVMFEYAKKDPRIKPFSKPNGGITSALNAGLDKAEGEYFCWLSSDDLFYPQKLELQIKAFKDLDESYVLVYGSFDILNHESKKLNVQPYQEALIPGCEFPEAFKFDFIDGCTIMIRMDVMKMVEGFNPSIVHSQDMELWVRLASYGYKFHLLPHKLTIRRVHEAQSSTTNMIHCRYDAVWMMNFYLEHYHLTEMYRYIDFNSPEGIRNFVTHFVGRMLHTEANINHPLLQEKFWNWFSEGIKVFSASTQNVLLRNVLIQLFHNRKSTYKIDFYIEKCIEDIKRKHEVFDRVYNYSNVGRNFRKKLRSEDSFANLLFEYGLNLLVNSYTPLFAQELFFHNTNKVVDTPYKLAHSVFRYLSQFDNPLRELVKKYSDLKYEPQNELEAINLFCDLALPDISQHLKDHLQLIISDEKNHEAITKIEDSILQISDKSKKLFKTIIKNNPTSVLLFYWNSLILKKEGKLKEALNEAWKIFEYHNRFLSWTMLQNLGELALANNDYEKAYYAYKISLNMYPENEKVKKELLEITKKYDKENHLIPNVPSDIIKELKSNLLKTNIADCQIKPMLNGRFLFKTLCIDENGVEFIASGNLSYDDKLNSINIKNPSSGKEYQLTANDLINFFANKYDFGKSTEDYLIKIANENKLQSIAFSIPNAASLSGGAIIAFRFIEWLVKLGVEVKVYSNDSKPNWLDQNIIFKTNPKASELYKSIEEDVIIVFSVLELPNILKYVNKEKRIFHLAQVVEDFHYHGFDFKSAMQPKHIFEILHSLPVGRISISKNIHGYLKNRYSQDSYLIENGIDLSKFKYRGKRDLINNEINIATIGNPDRLLKGINDVVDAAEMVALSNKDLKINLKVLSGVKPNSDKLLFHSGKNINIQMLWGLSQKEVSDILAKTDIYVNASWYEGFGLPTIEAMASGVPVIQANNKGLDSIIKDNQNCIIFPPADVKKLAEAINKVLSDNKLKENIIKGGLQTSENFSLSHQFENFVNVFEKILITKFNDNLVGAIRNEIKNGNIDTQINEGLNLLNPKISVILTVKEHHSKLKETLDSLLNQIYSNWEAVIVFNEVDANTSDLIRHYSSNDVRIRKVQVHSANMSAMLNIGLNNISGEWIVAMPSGTIYTPNRFVDLINGIEQEPNKNILFSEYYSLANKNIEPTIVDKNWIFKIPNKKYQILGLLNSVYIYSPSMVIKREVFDKIGYFNEEFDYASEYYFLLNAHLYFDSAFIKVGGCAGDIPNIPELKNDTKILNEFKKAQIDFLIQNNFENLFPSIDFNNINELNELNFIAHSLLENKYSLLKILNVENDFVKKLNSWVNNQKSLNNFGLLNNISSKKIFFNESHFDKNLLHKDLSFKKKEQQITEKSGTHNLTKNVKNLCMTDLKKDKLVSIIILSYNSKKYIEELLQSIKSYTKTNFEFVIVDNNSDETTTSYLTEFSNRNQNVNLILNADNLGFPKGINQGILAAKGDYILIANNDIVVTKNWLTRMIEVAESNEKIGIVGPISNFVSGVQLDKNAKYNSIEDMHKYAGQVANQNKNKVKEFPRVAFLCTLIKKEVIDKIGGLDERFSPGNFEDDDFCLRAQLAGYKTVIAKDVFIHHYGSVSFKQNGSEKYAERLKINEQKFIDKWGTNPEGIWLKNEKIENRAIKYSINTDKFIESITRTFDHVESEENDLALENIKIAFENFDESDRTGYENLTKEDLLNIAGTLSLSKNQLENAKMYFEQQLEYNPNSSTACFGLGEVFKYAELYNESKTMYEWAIINDSENKNAQIRLREINLKLNLPENHNSLVLEQETDKVT